MKLSDLRQLNFNFDKTLLASQPTSKLCLWEIFNIILYFPVDCLFRVKTVTVETANVTNCHAIATDILFLSSNHRSVQFLYLAASAITLAAILKARSARRLARLSPSRLPLRAHRERRLGTRQWFLVKSKIGAKMATTVGDVTGQQLSIKPNICFLGQITLSFCSAQNVKFTTSQGLKTAKKG